MSERVKYESMGADTRKEETDKLREQLSLLLAENDTLKKSCRDNDIDVESINLLSDAERICIGGINALLPFFENGTMTSDDTKVFDILHKNLMAIRKYDVPKESKKTPAEINVAELLTLVGEKK